MANSKIFNKIISLHPKKDAWEIVRLTVFYEFPWDYNRALELALYKTYAVPSISKILYSTKQFDKVPQKRYDDTDLLLSEIIENGLQEGRGLEALKRMNFIHSNYKISNEDYLYVLSTFIYDVGNWINKYGYRKLTSHEELAGFYVWKEIGEQMGIKNIPDSIVDFRQFHDDFEKEHFKYSETNAKVARSTEDLMLGWYMPKFMFATARPFLYAVMEPHLLKAFNYKEPGKAMRELVTKTLKARSLAFSLIPRTKPYIRTRDHKHKSYPNGYTLNDLGPEKLKQAAGCPFHNVMESQNR